MLAQIDGSSVSTSGGFCDYLKDRVKNIGTNCVCKNPVTSALPIVGSLCDYVVGEVGDAVDNAVVGPAFDPFCGEIVSVAKKDFDVDLDRSFVAAKDISANLAGHLCGNYLCPGQTDVCQVVTGARDGAVKLASVVCTLLGGAKNMANIAGALCFPATASVTLENGSQKMMKDIQIGDRVKIGKDRYSEVFMWTHRLEHIITDFVKITHDHGELILTAGHYLYANGQILPANSVKIGDQIPLHDGSMSTIRSITTSIANGLYNPQTRDGDIAFNGVVTTTYTTVAHPVVAKGFLLVMQTIPSLARRLVGDRIASVNVIPSWASGIMGFLPAGTK